VIKADGPHFSFGGEVREWLGKDINWFRTFVAEVNLSYRAIEALRVPTIGSAWQLMTRSSRGLGFYSPIA
jgi:enoyl-CoA hydratase/carnithine racemase